MREFDVGGFADRDPELERLEREVSRHKSLNNDYKATIKALRAEITEAESRARLVDDTRDIKPVMIKPRGRSKKNQACPVLSLSDLHFGELVDPATISGMNEYNADIARSSVRKFFQNSVRLIEAQRVAVNINQLLLWLGGDLITGYLHEEQVESNTMSPTEELLEVTPELSGGIDFLLENAGVDLITVVGSYGNHGRTTQKKRISTGAKNSYEWLMYHNLRRHYAKDDRVKFVIPNGSHAYVDVLGTPCRFTHGDSVRYGGGVGGLSIPLRKATDSWDTFKPVKHTFIGHWHQRVDFGFAIVNGSVIGYNAYALEIKARYEEPQQSFVLIDKDHGKTISAPIFVR